MNNRRPVERILGINALAWGIALGAQLGLWATGNNSSAMHVYAALMVGLFALCLGCLACTRRNPDRALLVYGWGALLIAAAMVIIDAIYHPDSPPSIMYAPVVGVIAIGSLIGFRQMVAYMIAHLVFILGVGVFYDKLREVLTPALLCVIGATVAIAIMGQFEFLTSELLQLKKMVKTFSDVKIQRRGNRD